jgi:hypothetical protein
MADIFLTQIVKSLGSLLTEIGKRLIAPTDQIRKHSYRIFIALIRIDSELEILQRALKHIKKSRPQRQVEFRLIYDSCRLIAFALDDIEHSIGKVEIQYEIYGEKDFIGLMKKWFRSDAVWMIYFLEDWQPISAHDGGAVKAAKRSRKPSEEKWLRDLSNLRKQINGLRRQTAQFIRKNYRLQDRPDGH